MMKQQRKQDKQKSKIQPSKPKQRQESQQPKFTKSVKKENKEHLPTIQNMLEIKPQDRVTQTTEYFKKVKTFLHTYLLKKIGSRVIQLMFKWGDQDVKTAIYKSILQHWKDLIKSKYALHTISKVSAEFQFPRLVQDSVLLQNNKEGSMVLENFLNKHQGTEKANQIIKKFQEIEKLKEEKGFESQQPLHNLAMKSIEKQYSHHKISKLIIKLAVPSMVAEQQIKVIEFFAQKSLDLLVDDEGVKLFVLLYNYFDSKQKKNVVKQLKGRVSELISLSRASYVGLIKILTETDDTVSVGNKIIPQILDNLADIKNNHSKVYTILISLLSPRNNNFNCLGKMEKEVLFTTCKKPEQTRKQEIRQFIYAPLCDFLTSEQNILLTCTGANQSRLALGVIKSLQSDGSEILKTFATKLVNYFVSNFNENKIENSKKVQIEQTLVAHNFGSKLIKNVLLLQETYIDKFCDKFSELFKPNLERILHSNASFVLTILIEKGRNELLDEIKKSRIDISKAKAADFYNQRLQKQK